MVGAVKRMNMAAKTLHELEIEIEKMKVLIEIIRRDLDMMLKIHKQEVTILDTVKPNTDAGKDTK